MALTTYSKTRKYLESSNKSAERLAQNVGEILGPHANDTIYKSITEKEDISQIKHSGQEIFNDAYTAYEIKSEMRDLRKLNESIRIISYVAKNPAQNKYGAGKIQEAHNIFDLAREKAEKYVKPQYSVNHYISDPHLMINTYIDYLQAKYQKDKDVFEQARYDQNNASNYKLVNRFRSKDLINKMEMDAMKGIQGRLISEVASIKTMENKYPELKGVSDYALAYVNKFDLTNKKNIGNPVPKDKTSLMPPKDFWTTLNKVESGLKVTEGMKNDPSYLKAEGYSQFYSGDKMNALITTLLADPKTNHLTQELEDIATNFHKKGLKRKMVHMRIEYKEFMRNSSVRAVNQILTAAVKLGSKSGSWRGASKEKEYDYLVQKHADLFLQKDANGYSKFQKIAAETIAFDAAFKALRTITTFGTKNIAIDKIRAERQGIIKEMVNKASTGQIYNEFISGMESSKTTSAAPATMDQSAMSLLGYSKANELIDSTKTLNISSLSKAEQDEFENAKKKIEDAVTANKQPSAIDTFSVIKYGNKALLLQFENSLPSRSRASIKRALLGQLDGIDVTAKNAAEKLEKARASFLTSILFESSSTSITNAVKTALGPSEYKQVKKTLLDAYGNDFAGYTEANWSYVNDSLKKACSTMPGLAFI